MPNIICTTCKRRFFGDAYLSLEDLQDDIITHFREEHDIELQVDPDLTWGDILKERSISEFYQEEELRVANGK